MNNVSSLNSLIQKRTEGVQSYSFVLLRNNQTYKPVAEHKYEASFAKDGSLVKAVPMQANEDRLTFSSSQLLDLTAGDYQLEIREIVDDKIHAIYPSDRTLTFHIKQNNDDLPTGTVSSLTLDEFEEQFRKAVKVATGVDMSDYYTKEQVDQVVDSHKPDLTGYAKESDLPQVTIDSEKRTITINGKSLQIPAAIDLSKLASQDDLVGLVQQTELTKYALKSQLPDMSKYATNVSVQNLVKSLQGESTPPMIYDVDNTLADMQGYDENERYFPADNGSFSINNFNQEQVKKKYPDFKKDYCKGIDGVIRKITGYTGATGEIWLSLDFIYEHSERVYRFDDRVLDETKEFIYDGMKNPQKTWENVYLVPGDILIDKNNDLFKVQLCCWRYGQRHIAHLLKLTNRGDKYIKAKIGV